jgi:hypothetical protein
VLDLILDKGLVIDAYVRVSLVGIEILTIDARIVVASVDTYLHFAEAVNRLDLRPTETEGLPGFMHGQRDGRGRELQQNGQGNGSNGSNRSQREGARSKGRGQQQRGGQRQGGDEGLVGRLAERGRWRED